MGTSRLRACTAVVPRSESLVRYIKAITGYILGFMHAKLVCVELRAFPRHTRVPTRASPPPSHIRTPTFLCTPHRRSIIG